MYRRYLLYDVQHPMLSHSSLKLLVLTGKHTGAIPYRYIAYTHDEEVSACTVLFRTGYLP
jgi:hypothetical protein